MKKELSSRELKAYQGKGHYCRNKWDFGATRRDYVAFFDKCAKQQNQHEKMFTEKRCPIFVATRNRCCGEIEWNAMLKQCEFFRVFDPYTAFQEIAMWVGNLAVPQKPIPVISDKMKVQTHGFNEWSFRKPPVRG